jgi:hypothetical protein
MEEAIIGSGESVYLEYSVDLDPDHFATVTIVDSSTLEDLTWVDIWDGTVHYLNFHLSDYAFTGSAPSPP